MDARCAGPAGETHPGRRPDYQVRARRARFRRFRRFRRTARMARVSETSSCICATSASMVSKRTIPRRRWTNSIPICSPYRSPSKSRMYASTRRSAPSKVGFVPTEIAASPSGPTVWPRSSSRDHPAGVHAVGRDGRVRLEAQVRGREAELAPALVAALDHAVEPVRAPERPRRRGHVARFDAGPDEGGADRRVAVASAAPCPGGEAERPAELGQQGDVAGGLEPEAEVAADDHAGRVQLPRPGPGGRTRPAPCGRTRG